MFHTERLVAASLLLLAACASSPPAATVVPSPVPAPPPTLASSVPAPPPPLPAPVGKMAHVPEGTFRMGSETGELDEKPAHPTHVMPFDLDLTEVTVAQYSACVRSGACRAAGTVVSWPGITPGEQALFAEECNDDRPERQDHAVNCVDWSMADAFCRWAGKRLPTEEEWEYAACGGDCDESARHGGDARSVTRGAARWPGTGRVARGQPEAFGLYDMAGNVWEWTASAYCPYDHPGCGDPRRVVRGGSWSMVDHLFVRLTDRSPSDPATRNSNIGFRCAK